MSFIVLQQKGLCEPKVDLALFLAVWLLGLL